MEQVGHRSNIVAHLPDHARTVSHGFSGFHKPSKVFCHCTEIHRKDGECLPSVVMQFPCDTPSFLVLQIQQAAGELPQAVIRMIEFNGPLPNFFFEQSRGVP